uniref:Methyltransferase domain-containing protein n=1 Tax=Mucochytrium quahogii TaxID=96639 RepID=A0A7S2SPV3_9STRA|mmetsp:Transcript_9086/g.17082  ORF Transcript_9086/g.17082 Transcript_9086/m.17082 type:complete len:235 (-) Transcript_9086:1675-2379(-)
MELREPVGHTRFSWVVPARDDAQPPVGHTEFSWAPALEDPFRKYGDDIDIMDDKHYEIYLFGEFQESFDNICEAAQGRKIENWVCPWQPSDINSIDAFTKFAKVSHHDVLLDLGCGDGRVLTRVCSQTGCNGIGIDVSLECVNLARHISEAEGQGGRARFVVADFCNCETLPDLSAVTLIYIYLVPKALVQVEPLVKQLCAQHKSMRVYTYEYHFKDWEPTLENKLFDLKMYTL